MISKFRAHQTAYVTMVLQVNKVVLVGYYTNRDNEGKETIRWVVKHEHNGGTYFDMAYESELSLDSAKYEKMIKKQDIQDRIESLKEELRRL